MFSMHIIQFQKRICIRKIELISGERPRIHLFGSKFFEGVLQMIRMKRTSHQNQINDPPLTIDHWFWTSVEFLTLAGVDFISSERDINSFFSSEIEERDELSVLMTDSSFSVFNSKLIFTSFRNYVFQNFDDSVQE